MEPGAWSQEHGARSMESGAWSQQNGKIGLLAARNFISAICQFANLNIRRGEIGKMRIWKLQ
jgi:hypothetical protein